MLRGVGEADTWPCPRPYPRFSDLTIRRDPQNMELSLRSGGIVPHMRHQSWEPAPERPAPKTLNFENQGGLRPEES